MKTSLNYAKMFALLTTYGKKYRVLITILIVVGVFGFAVVRINSLSNPKANEDKLVETLASYKEVKIDDETVEKVRKLIESDVKIDPQFNNRNNPFAE